MTALLLDAHLKSSLAAIRSLGRQGIPIIAGSYRRTAMGLYSRYVGARFVYPSPLEDRRGFVEAVLRRIAGAGKTVLLAFSDSTLLPLVRDPDLLARHGITYILPAGREYFDIAFDKLRTLRLAQAIGVETPATYACAKESDLSPIAGTLSFPVVVKPRSSLYWQGNVGTHKTATFAFSPEDLIQKCAAVLSQTGEFPLVQEYVRGEEAGVEFLCDRGRVLAACAHRRIRSLSPAGGPAVVKETVPLSYRGLGDRATRLVAELRWSGPIMVEFKMDRESGVPKLMETNGRFWGSLPLAVAAGSDFPYLYYQFACGRPVAASLHYRTGVISRHFLADLRNLLWVLFKRDAIRPWAYPGRLRAVRDFMLPRKSCKPDVLDVHDINPALAEIVDTVHRILLKQFWWWIWDGLIAPKDEACGEDPAGRPMASSPTKSGSS